MDAVRLASLEMDQKLRIRLSSQKLGSLQGKVMLLSVNVSNSVNVSD